MQIKDMLLTVNNYSRPGGLNTPEQIVIHYTGNPGTSAEANRNYFNNLANTKATYASSHYIVGLKGEIIRCIPENEIAYHAAHTYTNSHSIGIEVCHPTSDGKFSDVTTKALIELCVDICKRYKLDPDVDIIRHYDVPNGKHKMCPLYYVNNKTAWYDLVNAIDKQCNGVNEAHKANVDKLVKAGIISSPDYWYDVDKITPNNIESLITKMANYIKL